LAGKGGSDELWLSAKPNFYYSQSDRWLVNLVRVRSIWDEGD